MESGGGPERDHCLQAGSKDKFENASMEVRVKNFGVDSNIFKKTYRIS